MMKSIKKLLFKLRSLLIKLLAGNDITVAINVEFDGEKGFLIKKNESEYLIVNNMNISNCDSAIYIEPDDNIPITDIKDISIK